MWKLWYVPEHFIKSDKKKMHVMTHERPSLVLIFLTLSFGYTISLKTTYIIIIYSMKVHLIKTFLCKCWEENNASIKTSSIRLNNFIACLYSHRMQRGWSPPWELSPHPISNKLAPLGFSPHPNIQRASPLLIFKYKLLKNKQNFSQVENATLLKENIIKYLHKV